MQMSFGRHEQVALAPQLAGSGAQNGGGGVHWKMQPCIGRPAGSLQSPAIVPAGQLPASGKAVHWGGGIACTLSRKAAPPQHGFTQIWLGPQLIVPHIV
jgi:hypothetical protein